MSDGQWGFTFTQENCVQCHACEAACKAWRLVEPGVRWRRVSNVWQGDYPNTRSSTVTVACQHCARPDCIGVCPTEAISKRDADGIVLVDRDRCIGCKACLEACPFDVPQFGVDGTMQKCDLCFGEARTVQEGRETAPPCVATCPTQAIGLVRMSVEEKAAAEEYLLTAIQNVKV